MQDAIYPRTLTPDHEEIYELDGNSYTLPAATLEFKKWQGERIKNTFGGKPLVDYEGIPMFAELAIQRTAVKAGWNSRWIETYAMRGNVPYYFTDWSDDSLTKQATQPLNALFQEKLLANIATQNDTSYYGCWDVLAWKDERTLFLESKHYKKDKIRDTQLKWVKAGLEAGLMLDNFLIVQWNFI